MRLLDKDPLCLLKNLLLSQLVLYLINIYMNDYMYVMYVFVFHHSTSLFYHLTLVLLYFKWYFFMFVF